MSNSRIGTDRLHGLFINNSPRDAVPVVFLHGFGGLAQQWRGLQTSLSFYAPTWAFDLPGHGQSLDYPTTGAPIVAARAVVAELDELGIDKAHIVGHSMGGAIASLIGLIATERVASLTLLAPGGYGRTLNASVLFQWASAQEREEIEAVMPAFFGKDYKILPKIIDFQYKARLQKGVVTQLKKIADFIFKGAEQGVLPCNDVLSLPCPICVVWGDEDQILPVEQAKVFTKAPDGRVDLHILKGVGHSPAEEAPSVILKLIRKTIINKE